MKNEPVKEGMLSPNIELIGLGHSIRVCEVCLREGRAAHTSGCC